MPIIVGHVDFAGTYHEARDCELRPRPQGPPILVGASGLGERVLRLAARHADVRAGFGHVQLGLNPNTVDGVASLAPVLERLDRG